MGVDRATFDGTALEYLSQWGTPVAIEKPTQITRAWFAERDGIEVFAKLFSADRVATWASVEVAIAGARLHSSIVPLVAWVDCCDGALFVYSRVDGVALASLEARKWFRSLPLNDRASAVLDVAWALTAVCERGYAVVDWYEGNMIYDESGKKIWLFDWELCVPGRSFVLEMEQNYGSWSLMAPEEFVKGSVIDETTLVYKVGRYALSALSELAEPLAEIFAKATYPAKRGRFQHVSEFAASLREQLRTVQR